jgi:hypothetical protein
LVADRIPVAPQSAGRLAVVLRSLGDVAASITCSVFGQRSLPSDFAIARANSSSRLVCGAAPSDHAGRGGLVPSRCFTCS